MPVTAVCWVKKAATGRKQAHAVKKDPAMAWIHAGCVVVITPAVLTAQACHVPMRIWIIAAYAMISLKMTACRIVLEHGEAIWNGTAPVSAEEIIHRMTAAAAYPQMMTVRMIVILILKVFAVCQQM